MEETKAIPEGYSEEKMLEQMKYLSDIVEGKVSLQDIAGLSDRDINAILVMGSMMYEQGRYREAEDLFRGAVLLNKNNPLAHSGLGTVLTASGKNDEALTALSEAIRLDDTDIASYVNRGEIHLKNANFPAASDDFRKAVELDPEAKDPGANRARAIVVGMSQLVAELEKRIEEKGEGA